MELHERAAILLRELIGNRGRCLFDDWASLVWAMRDRWPQYDRRHVHELCHIRRTLKRQRGIDLAISQEGRLRFALIGDEPMTDGIAA